jgi:hypothetical protein
VPSSYDGAHGAQLKRRATMKLLLAIAGLMLSCPSMAQPPSLLEVAEGVRDEGGLERLVAASFGGGKHYEVKGSPFHVVDLMPTSGILSTEIFVYESLNGQLKLRIHIPRQAFVVTKAELQGNTLIISEKPQRGGDWKVRLHLVPTAAKRES